MLLTKSAPLVLVAGLSACGPRPWAAGVHTHDTRALVRIDYDSNGDGRIDVRTYMRDGRPVRLEGDADDDGRIDRWEYYDADGGLLRIGIASQGDGREDAWAKTVGEERHVERSTRRDGIADRREIYRGDALVRAESDTNHDGLPDTWEEFQGGILRRLLLDDEKRHGRPTRRIVYDGADNVRVEAIKEDDDASR